MRRSVGSWVFNHHWIAIKQNQAAAASRRMFTAHSVSYENCSTDYELINYQAYLLEIEKLADPSPIPLNESHRKRMLRTLTGMTDLDERVRARRFWLQWQKAISFCRRHLLPLHDMQVIGAPNFVPGLFHCDRPYEVYTTPSRWFSSMATGELYKGRFEWLLVDIAPELISEYLHSTRMIDENIVRFAVVKDLEIKNKEAALKCIDLTIRKQYSISNGIDVGRRTESELSTFLEQHITSDQHVVLENVFVKPRATKGSGIIVFEGLCKGMSAEFDRLVIERDGGHVRIHQVWEAKRCISPMSLYNTTSKKGSALREIMNDDTARFIWNDEKLRIHKQMPILGIYGSLMHCPVASARRFNAFSCQRLLSRSVNAVMEALETGVVSVTKDMMLYEMDVLRQVVTRNNLIIAVPRETAVSVRGL